ncbi:MULTISPECIES: HEAT repeat domain-containing protein [Clostridium]|uniref:HEAT repeat domain-containing protein n=1 Tax=Clostridium faecium TaxID=2762223 RepID=A0ABR8YWD9_9CLOT|nr:MULTISPECIES: HEAT repeat domain-containing protein [Clostridium]MBD8048555.1 HEAT repeat domain-containing protein [Clostridium faecium]MDU1347806.1 HEAT repeat domain-containing protein [Clostridium argentinense]
MSNGLVKFDWNFAEKYSSEEISYFLHLEGKSIEAISIIRGLQKAEVQKHIISCKIKYRYVVKSENIEELFKTLSKVDKSERIYILNSLDVVNKTKLIDYILRNHLNVTLKEKEFGIWVLGELKASQSVDFLIKSTVHKFVNIRRLSVSALGKIGDPKAEMALLRALQDENNQVVSYAIKSLQKIRSKKAIEKVKEIYKTNEKEYIKKACEEFIGSFD